MSINQTRGGAAFGRATASIGGNPTSLGRNVRQPASLPDWGKFNQQIFELMPGALKWQAGVEKAAVPKGYPAGSRLDAEAAEQFLVAMRERMIQVAMPLLVLYSPADWLWVVRHVDAAVVGLSVPLLSPGEEIPIFRVTENVTAFSAATDTELAGTSPDWDKTVALRIARLLCLATRINVTENWLRRVGKGQGLIVRANSVPGLQKDLAFEAALQKYDDRHTSRVERWYIPIKDIDASAEMPLLAAFKFYRGWHTAETWTGPLSAPKVQMSRAQFTIRAWDLMPHGALNLIEGSLSATADARLAASVLVLANALYRYVLETESDAGQTLPKFGVLLISNELLMQYVDQVVAHSKTSSAWSAFVESVPDSGSEVLDCVTQKIDPGSRSAYGPVLRPFAGGQLIDVNSLTWRLSQDLKLDSTRGGGLVNSAAFKFEEAVQEVIDNSRFKPSPPIRELRGRHLGPKKSPITDVDALFEVGDTVVLVSCKRIELGQAYDTGNYVKVRNAEEAANRALDAWREKVSIIRDNPVGNNYDFSKFGRIEGIVITPELVFSRRRDARETISVGELKIPRLTSFDELADLFDGLKTDRTEFRERMRRPHS